MESYLLVCALEASLDWRGGGGGCGGGGGVAGRDEGGLELYTYKR